MDSFRYRGIYQLAVNSGCIVKTNVSCLDQFQEAKELLGKEHTKVGRYEPKEHLNNLLANNSLANPSNPMLVCGIRNVMSNHRCIVYTATNVSPEQPPPYAVTGEEPHRSQRPYYIMAEDITGKLALKEYLPFEEPLEKFRWLFSGVPVLWDDISPEEIFRMILTEAADHSHVYSLPRGNHPEATDQTRHAWKQMHDVFIEQLYAPLDVAFKALHTTATKLNLRREADYIHSIMGIDNDNNLLLLVGHGKLEDLGRIMREELAAKRAICVENSGSITLLFYPEGILGPEISLIAAPNQRRPGTAFLVIELKDKSFGIMPVAQKEILIETK